MAVTEMSLTNFSLIMVGSPQFFVLSVHCSACLQVVVEVRGVPYNLTIIDLPGKRQIQALNRSKGKGQILNYQFNTCEAQ